MSVILSPSELKRWREKREESIRRKHERCNHGQGRAWEKVIINKLPHYRCRHCGATQAQIIFDETATERELLNPIDTVLARPDFGAPCRSWNLAQEVRAAVAKAMKRGYQKDGEVIWDR